MYQHATFESAAHFYLIDRVSNEPITRWLWAEDLTGYYATVGLDGVITMRQGEIELVGLATETTNAVN